MGDLVGHERAAGAAALGPAVDVRARRRSGRRPAGGGRRTGRAGSPGRPGPRSGTPSRPPSSGIRRRSAASASRARVSSFSLTSSSSRAASHSCGETIGWRVHSDSSSFRYSSTTSNRRPQRARWRSIHSAASLEHVGLEREAVRPALDHARDDAGLLEHLQVLRDRGLRDAEAAGGLADGRRARGEALDDAAADRVREGLERIVNHTVNDIRDASRTSGRRTARR